MDGEGTKTARREVEQKRCPEKDGTVLWKFLWKIPFVFIYPNYIFFKYIWSESVQFIRKNR
jgi:hypothetical protein